MANKKIARRLKIKARTRSAVAGTNETPRLTVYRSNKGIYAQIVDDTKNITVASATSDKNFKGNKVDQAKEVGKKIAEKATGLGLKKVKFDRNGYLYHGRVKSLADAARENGLEF